MRYRALRLLGYIGLITWSLWWLGSIKNGELLFGQLSWLPVYKDVLGLDFFHNYLATRHWLAGGNPYLTNFGDFRGLYAYPPPMLPLFSWVVFVPDPRTGAALWALFIAASCAFCVWRVQIDRSALGWPTVPTVVLLAAVLWSAPVVLAMERGNCDALVLVAVVFAAWALSYSRGWQSRLFAAALLALASLLKIYPLLVIGVLLAMRQYMVLTTFLVCVAGACLLLAEPFSQWLAVMTTQGLASTRVSAILEVWYWLRGETPPLSAPHFDWSMFITGSGASLHSPAEAWAAIWSRLGVIAVAEWPVPIVHVATLAPVTLWGFWAVFRTDNPLRMALPVLLWVMALATYWMPDSYDYNLIFLPLLATAFWDSTDIRWLTVILLSLPWWLPFGPDSLAYYDWVIARVALKVVSLYGFTWLLVRNIERCDEPPSVLTAPLEAQQRTRAPP